MTILSRERYVCEVIERAREAVLDELPMDAVRLLLTAIESAYPISPPAAVWQEIDRLNELL